MFCFLGRPGSVMSRRSCMPASSSFGSKQTKKTDTPSPVGAFFLARVSHYSLFFVSPESALHSAFDKAVRAGSNPRVMLINSPSNPTGQAFTKANLQLLADFCRDRGITLISDDIYSDVCFGDQYGASACSGPGFNEGRKILTGGLSKVGVSVLHHVLFANHRGPNRLIPPVDGG